MKYPMKQWSNFNLDGLMLDLVSLKFKCLHSLKFERKEIHINVSDIQEKFKKAQYSYKKEYVKKKNRINDLKVKR